jgi:uncharacterized DUF497 family protein
MSVEFDAAKNAANLRARGIGLVRFMDMELDTAVVIKDTRKDYGEPRFRFWGLIDGRLHTAVITPRGEKIRVVSLRKSNSREVKAYVKTRKQSP